MRLLLDTSVFLWMIHGQSLPTRVTEALGDLDNQLLLSIASPLEMQIKVGRGNLSLAAPVRTVVEAELTRGTIALLPITLDHIDALTRLPSHHRDPFDRLLVAQALHERLTIVTPDRDIAAYDAPVLWA